MRYLLTYLFIFLIPCAILAQVDTTSATPPDTGKASVPETVMPDSASKDLDNFEELRFADEGATMLPDSLQTHSVKKAVIMSMAMPGLGQIYNGKWWKTPIVYGAIAVPISFAVENGREYKRYLAAVYDKLDTIPNELGDQYSGAQLVQLQDYYRRKRDLWILVTVLGYGLNILDAYVDAHLYYYDISDNISLKWEPAIWRNPAGFNNVGISLKLDFK